MVERTGQRTPPLIHPGAVGKTAKSDGAASTRLEKPTEMPDTGSGSTPKGVSHGMHHHRNLNGTGPSALVGVRVAAQKGFTSPEGIAVARLLDDVDQPGPSRVAAANQALDTIINYLDQRTDFANQVGSMHRELAAAPTDERVPLLRRAIHSLRKAVRDGILPPHNRADLNRLAKISQGMGWNFDLDDNIASLDTKIIVFNKDTGEERPLSTSAFAEAREVIGKSGEFERYEILTKDGAQNSFRNFRDAEDPSIFWRDFSEAMDAGDWKGPSWDAFQRAMSSPTTAQWSTIITARGHYPNTIHAGMRNLQDLGHIEHVLPRENIFPVNLPGLSDRLKGDAASPSSAKVRVMEQYLDRLQNAPFGPSAQPVVSRDGGKAKRFLHMWGFSDDDYGTFKKTVEELGAQVKEGRWPDVKITVFFTGEGHPEAAPHAVVITSDGTTRPRLPAEAHEVDRALEGIAKLERSQHQI